MFYVKRTYGSNLDWLHSWDEEWGTRCMVSKDKAMSFSSLEAASIACDRANTTCKHMCHGMKFTVDGEVTKKSDQVSLYLTRSGKVAFEIIRTLNSKGEYSYRYHGKHGAGCGSLKTVVDNIRFVLQLKPSIKLAKGVDILQLKYVSH
jgi:hypothetical protein